MSLNNSVYCTLFYNESYCCQNAIAYCNGVEYPNYCQESDLFEDLAIYVETPIDAVEIVFSSIIILISIFGQIDGTFKWCIMNIAIMHLFYPIFTRFIIYDWLAKIYTPARTDSWGWPRWKRGLFLNGI
jgi:hypothetical protein